jgi:protein-disulfide isomerase
MRQTQFGVRIPAKIAIKGDHRVKRIFLSRPVGILLFVATLAAALSMASFAQTKAPASSTPKPDVAAAGSANVKALGSKSAPITMEVFGDFQCPACRAFYEATSKQVIDNYVNTGKVYLIHRDFPLPMHMYAMQAARLANAAAALGMFEDVERALYDKQDEWSPTGKIDEAIAPSFSPAQLKKIHDFEAQHLAEINASIESDRTMGDKRSVNATPTIFVSSRGKTQALPAGPVKYDLLKGYLDYLLRQ